MKKLVFFVGFLTITSCATPESSPQPAKRSISSQDSPVWICTAVCQYFTPFKSSDPRDKLHLGVYLTGHDLIVTASPLKEDAVSRLEKKCSDAAPNYNVLKSTGVDLNIPSESLGDKEIGWLPEVKLKKSNTDEFCYQGEYTDFIHYADSKTVNPNNAKFPRGYVK